MFPCSLIDAFSLALRCVSALASLVSRFGLIHLGARAQDDLPFSFNGEPVAFIIVMDKMVSSASCHGRRVGGARRLRCAVNTSLSLFELLLEIITSMLGVSEDAALDIIAVRLAYDPLVDEVNACGHL